jgi:hypothetical protein
LGVILGLLIPAGYALLLFAGLPDRTRRSRILLSGAILATAAASVPLRWTTTGVDFATAILGILACILAVAACVRASRSKPRVRFLGWMLLTTMALHSMMVLVFRFQHDSDSIGYFLLVVAAGGITFAVAALRLKMGKRP